MSQHFLLSAKARTLSLSDVMRMIEESLIAQKIIYDARNCARAALSRQLDEQFSDMEGNARWSAAVWQPIENFL